MLHRSFCDGDHIVANKDKKSPGNKGKVSRAFQKTGFIETEDFQDTVFPLIERNGVPIQLPVRRFLRHLLYLPKSTGPKSGAKGYLMTKPYFLTDCIDQTREKSSRTEN